MGHSMGDQVERPSKKRRRQTPSTGGSAFANALSDAIGATFSSETQEQSAKPRKGAKEKQAKPGDVAADGDAGPMSRLERKRAQHVAKEKEDANVLKQQQHRRRGSSSKAHTVPESVITPAERRLNKLATRGVVKLFNAVQRQRKLSKQPTAKRKKTESEAKAQFMDLLDHAPARELESAAGGADADDDGFDVPPVDAGGIGIGTVAAPDVQWDVLGEDYMLGKPTHGPGAMVDDDDDDDADPADSGNESDSSA